MAELKNDNNQLINLIFSSDHPSIKVKYLNNNKNYNFFDYYNYLPQNYNFTSYNYFNDIRQEEAINFPNNVKVRKIFPNSEIQNLSNNELSNDNIHNDNLNNDNLNNDSLHNDNLNNDNFSNSNLSEDDLTNYIYLSNNDLSTLSISTNKKPNLYNNSINIQHNNSIFIPSIQENSINNESKNKDIINNNENEDKENNNEIEPIKNNNDEKENKENNNEDSKNLVVYNIDNNINLSFISQPKFNIRNKKTKLKFPEESKQSISSLSRSCKSETLRKPYIKKKVQKSIKQEEINYANQSGFKELDDFNPDLWKKLCRKEGNFFNYDKGNVINTKITTVKDSNETEVYIGEVNQNNEKNGFGKLISPTKKRVGTWRENKFTGWGREIREGGEMYEGKFIDGELNGKGIYKKGNIYYIGNFSNFKKQGKGDLFTKKFHYRGEFNDDEMNGEGRAEIYEKGIYEGTFKDNEITGKGVYMFKDGSFYQGDMKKGEINGFGKFNKSDGTVFEGKFINGFNGGNVKITFADGSVKNGRIYNGEIFPEK